MTNGNHNVFTLTQEYKQPEQVHPDIPALGWLNTLSHGLTKREYFSACALQMMQADWAGKYSQWDIDHKIPEQHGKWFAVMAVTIADALITALNEKSKGENHEEK
jgi:hypothetical protein